MRYGLQVENLIMRGGMSSKMEEKIVINGMEFLDAIWFNNCMQNLGIVKCKDISTNKVKFYIGVANGRIMETDVRRIMSMGNKFTMPKGFYKEGWYDEN